jgi:hypothetical protein
LVVIDDNTAESTPADLRELAGILKSMGQKFKGRKAIVATHPGRVTTSRLVALIASTDGDVEAFTSEDAARAWLQSG